MSYDELILEAISKRASVEVVSLVEILWYVDGRNKTLLNYDEVDGGLRRLIQDKRIIEADHLQYRVRSDGDEDRSFSGLNGLEYEAALTEYRRQFFAAYSALKDEA